MRNLVLCAGSLMLIAASSPSTAADANAKDANVSARATCDAKYYDYLIGKYLDAARDVSGTSNYRVLSQGAAAGAAQPKRMTIMIDKRNQILDVNCG